VLLKKRSLTLVIYLTLIGVFTSLSLILILPVNYSYYALSNGSSGHRELLDYSVTWTTSTRSLRDLDATKLVLVTARSTPVSSGDFEELVEFTSRGGVVVAYGSREYVESILRNLGFEVALWGLLRDPVFSESSPERVLVELVEWNTTIILDTPYVLNVTDTPSIGELVYTANTSVFSFVDVNENDMYDLGEPIGGFPVIYTVRIGSGVIVVVCAHGVFTNSVLRENTAWLNHLASGDRSVVLDQSEFRSNLLAYLKLLVFTPRGVSPLFILIVSLVVVVVLYYVYLGEGYRQL